MAREEFEAGGFGHLIQPMLDPNWRDHPQVNLWQQRHIQNMVNGPKTSGAEDVFRTVAESEKDYPAGPGESLDTLDAPEWLKNNPEQ